MYNVQPIYYCWSCHKEHDLNRTSIFQSFLCECGGYVITPSGRVQMELRLTCEIYKIVDDGRVYYIAAENQKEAEMFYQATFDGFGYEIRKCTEAEINTRNILNKAMLAGTKKDSVSLRDMTMKAEHIPALIQ